MNIVNLLGNDVWSPADILNRTEAMVRSEFSVAAETILNRRLQGAAFGIPMSADEQAELARFQSTVLAAQAAGAQASADMAKLQRALDYEAAQRRLDLSTVTVTEPATVIDGEGVEIPNPAIAQDMAERAAAQAVINVASVETLELVALRAPVPETIPEEVLL